MRRAAPKKRNYVDTPSRPAKKRMRGEARHEEFTSRTEHDIANNTVTLRNQQQSPLLRLPLELREIIWGYAFGSRTIHPLSSNRSCPTKRPARIIYYQCREPLSDFTVYELSLQGASDNNPYRWKAEALEEQSVDIYSLAGVHKYCCRLRIIGFGAPLVCKQLYYEAMPVVWKTTTFCFLEPDGFRYFARMPSVKKHLIKQLAISPRGCMPGDWSAAVTPAVVASFSALKGLHLILTEEWWPHKIDALKSPPHHLPFLPNLIKPFQQLPLKADRTTVWMTAIPRLPGEPVEAMPFRHRTFTVERQREVAEHIRGLLLQYKPR